MEITNPITELFKKIIDTSFNMKISRFAIFIVLAFVLHSCHYHYANGIITADSFYELQYKKNKKVYSHTNYNTQCNKFALQLRLADIPIEKADSLFASDTLSVMSYLEVQTSSTGELWWSKDCMAASMQCPYVEPWIIQKLKTHSVIIQNEDDYKKYEHFTEGGIAYNLTNYYRIRDNKFYFEEIFVNDYEFGGLGDDPFGGNIYLNKFKCFCFSRRKGHKFYY